MSSPCESALALKGGSWATISSCRSSATTTVTTMSGTIRGQVLMIHVCEACAKRIAKSRKPKRRRKRN